MHAPAQASPCTNGPFGQAVAAAEAVAARARAVKMAKICMIAGGCCFVVGIFSDGYRSVCVYDCLFEFANADAEEEERTG